MATTLTSDSAVDQALQPSSSSSVSTSASGKLLLSLPPEILDLIALYTAVDTHSPSPLPTSLRNLILTCRQIHAHLTPTNNPRLYARIFRFNFDTSAIARRLGRDAVSSRVLCDELRRRCVILKRVRHATRVSLLRPEGPGEVADVAMRENLWLAYLMCLENDGLNAVALHWADIKGYLALHHTQEMLESALEPGYPPESEDRALALHVKYLITDPAELADESKDEAEEKLFILRPFVFASHKFESFYAPWTLRSLPIRRAEEPGEAMEEVERERQEAARSAGAAAVAGQGSSGTNGGGSTASGASSSVGPPSSSSSAPPPRGPPGLATLSASAPPATTAAQPAIASQPTPTPAPPAPANPFLADLAPKIRTTTITHCGRQLILRPPVLAHAAYFSFFNQVECDPAVVGLQAIVERGAEPGTRDANAPANGAPSRPPTQLGLLHPSLSGGRVGEPENQAVLENPASTGGGPLYELPSLGHDKDLARLVACHDPYRSPGLKPCFFAGVLEGAWEGRFSFFDFDSYREMLAGRMQSLYEGPFGEQPQVWKLKEHFVRVGGRTGRKEGGEGGIISAGFGIDDPMDDVLRLPRTLEEARQQAREVGSGTAGETQASSSSGGHTGGMSSKTLAKGKWKSSNKRFSDEDDESMDTFAGGASSRAAGSKVVILGERPADYHLYPRFTEEEGGDEAAYGYLDSAMARDVKRRAGSSSSSKHSDDDTSSSSDSGLDPERYEMLISGIGHSAWGRFVLRGRVRAWDGMFILSKEYRPDGRGRWLYRGYAITEQALVGRWRDSLTPREMSGYEGPFVLKRRRGGEGVGVGEGERGAQ